MKCDERTEMETGSMSAAFQRLLMTKCIRLWGAIALERNELS